MKNLGNRLIVMMLIVLVIGVVGYLTREVGSMQWLIENETRMRGFIQQHPWPCWLLGFGIYTAFSLVPGTSGKSVVWGWLFGFWPAVVTVDIGLTIAAVLGFLASRYLLRDAVQARFGRLVGQLDNSLKQDGGYYLLMLRLAHAPYSFVNYGAGATSVPLRTFAGTTAVGVLPGTMIFVLVGTRIPTLATLHDHGPWQLLDPLLVGILAATFLFPMLVRFAVRRYRSHAGKRPELEWSEVQALDEWTAGG